MTSGICRVKQCARTLVRTTLVLLLLGALLPGALLQSAWATSSRVSANSVTELLSAGDYVEGEVLAVLAKDVSYTRQEPAFFRTQSFAARSEAQNDDLLMHAEPLMEVSSRTYAAALDPSVDALSSYHESDVAASSLTLSPASFDFSDTALGDALYPLATPRHLGDTKPSMDAQSFSLQPPLRGADKSIGDQDVRIVRIKGQDKSTKNLLEMLQKDSRVLSVQPNYICSINNPLQDGAKDFDLSSIGLGTHGDTGFPKQADATNSTDEQNTLPLSPARDLTSFQWGAHNSATTMVDQDTPALPGFDIAPPRWNVRGATNAAGVVAVVDSGVDYRNPDLAGVMCDMTPYSLRGGRYGYRSSAGGDPTDPIDDDGHGTHIAGIIAGAWDGSGISGVVSGVQVVAVRVSDPEGRYTSDSIIKGYDYLCDAVEKGLPLKAVNNSWGFTEMDGAIKTAITKLGEKGVISFFASGNDAADLDKNPGVAVSLLDSPYVVTVDASNNQGELAIFSNYGVETTDVVAPGEDILSTLPLSKRNYLAEADPTPIAFESFQAGAKPQIKVHKSIDASEELGDVVYGQSHFDALGGALKIPLAEASLSDESEILNIFPDAKSMVLSIPVDKQFQKDVRYFNMHTLLVPHDYDGLLVQFKVKGDSGDGWTDISKGFTAMYGGWSSVYADLKSSIAATGGQLDFGSDDCLQVRLTVVGLGGSFGPAKALFLDTVGLGRADATVPYGYKSGTSMATPMALGAAMVLSQYVDQSMPAPLRAAELAARVKATVRPVDDFADRCSSGGAIDLSYNSPEKLTPVVSSAQIEHHGGSDQLIVRGHFFGSAPATLMVAGIELPITTWSDTKVVASVIPALRSGVNRVGVRASNGHRGQKGFLLNFSPSSQNNPTPLFEKDIKLPSAEQGYSQGTSRVVMAGLGGYLYLLPEDRLLEGGGSPFLTMMRFDPASQSWRRCANLPERMEFVSLADYDGLLYAYVVKDSKEEPQAFMYAYNPRNDVWNTVSTKELPLGASLINNDEELLLVGKAKYDSTNDTLFPDLHNNIMQFDPESGEVHAVGSLQRSLMFPEVVARQNKVYVTDSQTFDRLSGIDVVQGSFDELTKQGDIYSSTNLDDLLPERDEDYDLSFNLAVGKQGVVALNYKGALKEGKQVDQDSYLLDLASGKTSFEGLGKRISRASLFNTAALAYDGWLYGFGFSAYEPYGVVLRATAFDTLPTPGDALTPKPAPSPAPPPDSPPIPEPAHPALPDVPFVQEHPSTHAKSLDTAQSAAELVSTGDYLWQAVCLITGVGLCMICVVIVLYPRRH